MKQYYCGTAIKITSIVSNTPASITISVKDSCSSSKISDAVMVSESDSSFYYIYQSSENDVPGTYSAIIEVVYAGYTTVSVIEFELKGQP